MVRKQLSFILISLLCGIIRLNAQQTQPKGLKDYYKNYFPIGVAVSAQNLKNPGAKISPRLERRKSFQSLGIGFLHQILGFMAVLREPAGEVIEPLKVRHG